MQLAAEFGTGDVFLSILWFFLFFIWIMLIFQIFGDILRSDMSGGSKALWSVLIIFLPYVGVFAYLVVNGSNMAERQASAVEANEEAVQAYIRNAAGSSADELAKLAELHASGKLDDAEFAAAKAKLING
ncbi:MAG: SHOCT domain-containing protein [Microthrixaceae bacterium]